MTKPNPSSNSSSNFVFTETELVTEIEKSLINYFKTRAISKTVIDKIVGATIKDHLINGYGFNSTQEIVDSVLARTIQPIMTEYIQKHVVPVLEVKVKEYIETRSEQLAKRYLSDLTRQLDSRMGRLMEDKAKEMAEIILNNAMKPHLDNTEHILSLIDIPALMKEAIKKD